MRTIDKQSPGPDCLSVAKRNAAVTGYAWPPPGPWARPLVVHPATSSPPRPETAFAFKPTLPDGENAPHRGVWVHAVDPSYAGDIDRLNLNARHLVQNRYGVREELQLALRRASMKGESAIRALFRRRLASASQTAPATLPPFAPIVAEYVSKKMVSKGMQP